MVLPVFVGNVLGCVRCLVRCSRAYLASKVHIRFVCQKGTFSCNLGLANSLDEPGAAEHLFSSHHRCRASSLFRSLLSFLPLYVPTELSRTVSNPNGDADTPATVSLSLPVHLPHHGRPDSPQHQAVTRQSFHLRIVLQLLCITYKYSLVAHPLS